MKPYAYSIRYARHTDVYPSLDAVFWQISKEEPHPDGSYNYDIYAHYPDGTCKTTNLGGYMEPCEPDAELVTQISKELDEAIEQSEKEWEEIQAEYAAKGQRYVPFSGQRWLRKKDRDDLLANALRKYRTRWKTLPSTK